MSGRWPRTARGLVLILLIQIEKLYEFLQEFSDGLSNIRKDADGYYGTSIAVLVRS